MMNKIKTIIAVAALLGGTAYAQDKNPYMGGEVELTELPNGGVINKEAPRLVETTAAAEPTIVKVTEGVWSLEGFSFVNFAVIEGETGLIVYDAGDDNKDGRRFLEAVKQVSDKPVHTIIYSHSHYVWGGEAMLQELKDYTVIGHPMINKNILESGGLGSSIPELAPVLTARAYEQFNIYLPEEGVDAPLSKGPIGSTDKAFVPVNRTVSNEEELVVDGIRMQFFTNYHSDTEDCLLVYLPEKGVVLNNLYWPVFPNLYTLRGSVYRNPIPWMDGLKKIRDLNPEHMLSTHITVVSGKENVREAVTNFHDGIAYVYDQTLRRTLLGESPDEMRHSIQLPEHLAEWPANQLTYGELSYYSANIYNYALGWYDGNATNINPVHPDVEAQKIVEGFGGKEQVKQAIQKAMLDKEYAWATQLSDYLFKVYPNEQEVRQLKADALRKMGQITKASIPRSWYLSQARALENKVKIPHIILPDTEQVMNSSPGTYVNMMRVRLDPNRSISTDQVIVFEFVDVKDENTFGLHVRKGVAEYLEKPENHFKSADTVISLPRSLFAEYYIGTTDINELLANKEVEVHGDKNEALDLLNQFDQFNAEFLKFK